MILKLVQGGGTGRPEARTIRRGIGPECLPTRTRGERETRDSDARTSCRC